MGRLIDADALIAEMHNVILEDGEDRRTFYEVIERQPTIEPQQQWTSVSKGLPEEPFACFVTVWDSTQTGEGDDFENVLPYFVGWDGEQWNDEDGEQCPFEVIAWQPLPAPYREGET